MFRRTSQVHIKSAMCIRAPSLTQHFPCPNHWQVLGQHFVAISNFFKETAWFLELKRSRYPTSLSTFLLWKMETSHQFFPLGLLLPHYIPNTSSLIRSVLTFTAGTSVIFAGTWILVNILTNKKIATGEKVLCLWFALYKNLAPNCNPEVINHLY